MSRIKLRKKDQIKFLNDIREKHKVNWLKLSNILNVHYRCLSDWKRGKYTLPENVFRKCIKLAKGKIEIPSYKILPEFWSIKKAAKKGGLVIAQKYGGPGTLEGRKKGGQISQIRRKLNPENYKYCNIRKNIYNPRKNQKLAELIGIILGDGNISKTQVTITLNKRTDKEYVFYVFNLIKELFRINPAIYEFNSLTHKSVTNVTVSSVNFVNFLLSMGLKRGNKVKQQVDIPDWIKNKLNLSISCLRGLIDTDGCVYYHKHNVQGYNFLNIGLQFSNRSRPILLFVKETLFSSGFTPKINAIGVNLYRKSEVIDYAKKIKFSNFRNSEKLDNFLKIKYKERCLSGLRSTPGKRVCSDVPRVRIPPSPHF